MHPLPHVPYLGNNTHESHSCKNNYDNVHLGTAICFVHLKYDQKFYDLQ